jgi:hypothetical protein
MWLALPCVMTLSLLGEIQIIKQTVLQDNYMEEAFKMRNLLQEFLKKHDGVRFPTILGLREHIFTGRYICCVVNLKLDCGCSAAGK